MKKWPLSIPMPEIVRLLGLDPCCRYKRLVEIIQERPRRPKFSERNSRGSEAQFHYQAYLDAFQAPA